MDTQAGSQNEIIDQFTGCVDHLEEVIKGLNESELDLSENGIGWTIRQYIHHIVDGDDIWKNFIKRAIGNPQGTFQLAWYWQFPQDHWAEAWHYAERAIEPSVEMLCASRAHVAQLLHQIPGALERRLTLCMPDGSENQVSVEEIVAMQTRHVEGHLVDIQRILDSHRVKAD